LLQKTGCAKRVKTGSPVIASKTKLQRSQKKGGANFQRASPLLFEGISFRNTDVITPSRTKMMIFLSFGNLPYRLGISTFFLFLLPSRSALPEEGNALILCPRH